MSISESYSLFLSTQYTCFIIIIITVLCHISFPFNFSFYFLNIFIQKGFDILCLLILCTNKSLWIKVFFYLPSWSKLQNEVLHVVHEDSVVEGDD